MGIVANFIQIFGSNPLLWFFPSKVDEPAQGEFWPRVPELSQADYEAHSKRQVT